MGFIQTVKNIWSVEDLRKRIGITLLLVIIYRFGCYVVLPGIDPNELMALKDFTKDGLMQLLDMFSGGAFAQASIFALGIMPYITASIVIQLLGMVLPAFQKMQREGESGRMKMNQYTRYLTVLILLVQGPAYLLNLKYQVMSAGGNVELGFWTIAYMTIILAAGSMFIMWLGERIDQKGIGMVFHSSSWWVSLLVSHKHSSKSLQVVFSTQRLVVLSYSWLKSSSCLL